MSIRNGWSKEAWAKLDETNKITFKALDLIPLPEVIVDPGLPGDTMYILNTKMLKVAGIPKFEWQGFKPDTAAQIAAEQDAANEKILDKAKLEAFWADAARIALQNFSSPVTPPAPPALPKAKKPELPAPAPRQIRFEDEDGE